AAATTPRRTPPASVRIHAGRTRQGAATAKGQAIEASTSHFIREHVPIMPVPVALESFFPVVLSFELEELRQLRITGLHLLANGPFMVGQKIAAAPLPGQVDQPAERCRSTFYPLRCM